MSDEKKSAEERRELGLYEKMAGRAKELIEEAKELTSETMSAAIEKARKEMVAAGEFTQEQGERLKKFMERDLQAGRDFVSKAGDSAREALEPHRLAAGLQGILANILETVGGALEEFGKKLDSELDFKTGEITTPGTLTCKSCGAAVSIKHTGHIPPCPKCAATEFHKSW